MWEGGLSGFVYVAPIEWSSELSATGAIPAEWNGALYGDHGTPVEWALTVPLTIDRLVPVEYTSQLGRDDAAPVEWGTSLDYSDSIIPIDWMDPLYAVYFDIEPSWYALANSADWEGRDECDEDH